MNRLQPVHLTRPQPRSIKAEPRRLDTKESANGRYRHKALNSVRPSSKTRALPQVTTGGLSQEPPKPKLLDQVRQAIRKRHYSDRTEKAYVHWIKRFIFFHNKRHPIEMGEVEIGEFLSSLATVGRVSASTQNQALNALLFLYKEVLRKPIGLVEGVVRAKRPQRLPVVLTKDEVKSVIDHMTGSPRLMAILLYGGGLRLMECCRLRVKDIDFSRHEIVSRAGKGDKDRHTMLPSAIKEPLLKHIEANRSQHQEDLKKGLGRVALPNALERIPERWSRLGMAMDFSCPATLHR